VIVTQEQLQAAHCWEAEDEVPRRPAMTDFRRQTRFQQALWREAHGHPIGTQPYRPLAGKPSQLVGSRIPLDYGMDTGANLVTPDALAAARHRTSFVEREQSFDHQRLWADLLSSEALAFNLFGDLSADLSAAALAAHTLAPHAPGTVSELRFAHSPGRLDKQYLNSLRAFDAAFVLEAGRGKRAIVAVNVRYHEKAKGEIPKPENWWRYSEVAQRAGIFQRGAVDSLRGRSDLCVMWLEHLLLLSMLQHPTDGWSWGRYIVVYPQGNVDQADMVTRYRQYLADDSTFGSLTLEQLLDSGALPGKTVKALGERYRP
jgi:hypothetical protein